MSKIVNVEVPDIGDFDDVDIIEVLVGTGDIIAKEDPLITLESDKATIEIPSPASGTVKEVVVNVNDKVSQGSLILKLEVTDGSSDSVSSTATKAKPQAAKAQTVTSPAITEKSEQISTAKTSPAPQAAPAGGSDLHAEVVVLGSGPGGYTAAFRAADLGKKVILIERYGSISGVCLNVGCIPSKALLHTAQIINEAAEMVDHGIDFGKPKIDIRKLAGFKNKVISQLTGGLAGLAKQRKVQIVTGYGKFTSPHTIEVTSKDGNTSISFDHAIIAAGSSVFKIPGFPYDDERLMDSTGALELTDIPKRLLVIGGGIIGLEMATVYDALGSKVSIVELSPGLIPGCDADLVRPLMKRVKDRYENIWLNAKVTAIEAQKKGLKVSFEGKGAPENDTFDRVLLAVGRSPNGKLIDADKAGVNVDQRGFITVDKQQRTNVNHIFAIGDIVGQPMLAHKGMREAKVAVEVIAGQDSVYDNRVIPAVVFTDPEIAWAGLTEPEAKAKGLDIKVTRFPWAASGRALTMGRNDGLTKMVLGPDTGSILGVGIVGAHAGELIAEGALAIEMGAVAEDLALTIHAHPTLSETVGEAAEIFTGFSTHVFTK
ncbi:MAG: dihydrolipoyl dehydrogenase [Candidatus Aminicenantes bacterium]|nr:MAG: dihydrolipoyl dehydrogenase [Candidatus Aminicenantes bacterium]